MHPPSSRLDDMISFTASDAGDWCLRTLARSLRKVCGVDHGCCVLACPPMPLSISCSSHSRCAARRSTLRAGGSVAVSNRSALAGKVQPEWPSSHARSEQERNCLRRGLLHTLPFCRLASLSYNTHATQHTATMPPLRTSRNRKPPPEGFDDIEDTLLEFANKMKDAENASHEGKKKHEMLWPVFQITHQRMYVLG